jgi:hypothetical protein
LEGDNENYITVNYNSASGTASVSGNARFRDNPFDSKEKALKALGWNPLEQKETLADAFLIGLSLGGLFSRRARDVAFRKEATRDWTITNPRGERATIARELSMALQQIARGAKIVIVKKQ